LLPPDAWMKDVLKSQGLLLAFLFFRPVAAAAAVQVEGILPGPTPCPIENVAGNGIPFSSGDGGPASQAGLAVPNGVAADGSGTVFIAEVTGGTLRSVDAAGRISTLASKVGQPLALVADGQGGLDFTDLSSSTVKRWSSSSGVKVLAGTGASGAGGFTPTAASQVALDAPRGLALASDGSLAIADSGNNVIRCLSPQGQLSVLAGTGTGGFQGADFRGPALQAQLRGPQALAFGPQGDLYIADTLNHAIRKLSAGTLSTVLGNGANGFSPDGPVSKSTAISFPKGLVVDARGALYFSDTGNGRVRRYFHGRLTTIASGLLDPCHLALDSNGALLVADGGANTVLRLPTCSSLDAAPGERAAKAEAEASQRYAEAAANPDFSVQPNPVSAGAELCLTFKQAPLSSQWQVYNMAGETVLRAGFFGQARQCIANTLVPGAYRIHVQYQASSGAIHTAQRSLTVTH
jgi:sugar lactone lactonase YvrE